MASVRVSRRGAARWSAGHPWIYRCDVVDHPESPGLVRVADERGRFIGQALYSPRSEIRLRLLEPSTRAVDGAWWRRAPRCRARAPPGIDATAWRMVHGEGDGLPSLIVDRYERWLVVQLLSAGLETMRAPILDALVDVVRPEGILLRNDVGVRRHEGLREEVELAWGSVPDQIEVREGPIRFLAAPWTGQKTGAFLDQRPNRLLAGELARREERRSTASPTTAASPCTWPGPGARSSRSTRAPRPWPAAPRTPRSTARTTSNGGRAMPSRCCANSNGSGGASRPWCSIPRRSPRPRALCPRRSAATRRSTCADAAARAGRRLLTASCSFHLRRPEFQAMLADAAADSGRRLRVERLLGQEVDHPEVLTIPETGYLKGAVLRAL